MAPATWTAYVRTLGIAVLFHFEGGGGGQTSSNRTEPTSWLTQIIFSVFQIHRLSKDLQKSYVNDIMSHVKVLDFSFNSTPESLI